MGDIRHIPFTIFIFCLLLGVGVESVGQVTYTTIGPNLWSRTPETGGCTSLALPPFNGVASCQIIINVNHQIDYTNLTIGNNISINVNSGGILNVSGNLSQTGQTTANISVNGGEINIAGQLIVLQGHNNGTQTSLNLDLRNNGKFNVSGILDMNSTTLVEITGDNSASIGVGLIELAQRAFINIREGGGLISNGETNYAGNNSAINVWGFFRTGSVKVSGGSGKQLNTFETAQVVVDGDLRIDGNGQITFAGDSNIYIDGDVILNGSQDRLIIKENAKVVVCGENTETNPAPSTVDKSGLIVECTDPNNCPAGGYYVNCRILPVKFVYREALFLTQERASRISWATATEWESSHFEIQRSIGATDDFKKIGEVSAMGWKDSNTEYEFIDGDLPLFGGNIYYRIKQVDINESYAYSDVMSIRTPELATTKGVWRAYPNPTNGDQLRIGLLDRSQYEAEQIHFRLIHPSVQSKVTTVASEAEMNEALATMTGHIPKGVFVVEIQWGQKVEHIKVLKP